MVVLIVTFFSDSYSFKLRPKWHIFSTFTFIVNQTKTRTGAASYSNVTEPPDVDWGDADDKDIPVIVITYTPNKSALQGSTEYSWCHLPGMTTG